MIVINACKQPWTYENLTQGQQGKKTNTCAPVKVTLMTTKPTKICTVHIPILTFHWFITQSLDPPKSDK
jgi:hypothetical protein